MTHRVTLVTRSRFGRGNGYDFVVSKATLVTRSRFGRGNGYDFVVSKVTLVTRSRFGRGNGYDFVVSKATGVVGHFHCYIVLKDNTPNARSYTIRKA